MLKKIDRADFGIVGAANDNVLVDAKPGLWASVSPTLRALALEKATAPKPRRGRRFTGASLAVRFPG